MPVLLLLILAACGGDSPTGNREEGPWIGTWVLVNFLATDAGGVWDADEPDGIGFVANITATEWTETDEDGAGCAITSSYTVSSNNRYSRQAIRAGSSCLPLPVPLDQLKETGRLEFSNDESVMTDWFDVQQGDDIAAFRWQRR